MHQRKFQPCTSNRSETKTIRGEGKQVHSPSPDLLWPSLPQPPTTNVNRFHTCMPNDKIFKEINSCCGLVLQRQHLILGLLGKMFHCVCPVPHSCFSDSSKIQATHTQKESCRIHNLAVTLTFQNSDPNNCIQSGRAALVQVKNHFFFFFKVELFRI